MVHDTMPMTPCASSALMPGVDARPPPKPTRAAATATPTPSADAEHQESRPFIPPPRIVRQAVASWVLHDRRGDGRAHRGRGFPEQQDASSEHGDLVEPDERIDHKNTKHVPYRCRQLGVPGGEAYLPSAVARYAEKDGRPQGSRRDVVVMAPSRARFLLSSLSHLTAGHDVHADRHVARPIGMIGHGEISAPRT